MGKELNLAAYFILVLLVGFLITLLSWLWEPKQVPNTDFERELEKKRLSKLSDDIMGKK